MVHNSALSKLPTNLNKAFKETEYQVPVCSELGESKKYGVPGARFGKRWFTVNVKCFCEVNSHRLYGIRHLILSSVYLCRVIMVSDTVFVILALFSSILNVN